MKKFPTAWFFVIGFSLAVLAIPVSLYLKTQSVLGVISIAKDPLNERLFLPQVSLESGAKDADIPAGFREEPPPGAVVDEAPAEARYFSDPYKVPAHDPDRLNVLLLGIRGVDDPYGGTLTDTIMIASYRYSTKKMALISIPRDLYLTIPFQNVRAKINYAYALGRRLGSERDALELARHTVQYVSGLNIDYVARADFTAFEQAIDALGGVKITLEKAFEENLQWQGSGGFKLPAGTQVLDGQTALYFVRSRYSTSDFDRARRQQQVIIALKDRAFDLNVVTNPAKIFDLLSIAGDHVRTDMPTEKMKQLLPLAQGADFGSIKTLVFDNRAGGRLYSTLINKQYVLLPKVGTFVDLRSDAQSIL